jgi:hypothetical protein
MSDHDWAYLEAADILASCATEGFTTNLQRKLAKRLREIADTRIADHQAGVERALDRVFGPEEVVAS